MSGYWLKAFNTGRLKHSNGPDHTKRGMEKGLLFQNLLHILAIVLYRNMSVVPFTTWSLLRLPVVVSLILVHWWLPMDSPIDFWTGSTVQLLSNCTTELRKTQSSMITNLQDSIPSAICYLSWDSLDDSTSRIRHRLCHLKVFKNVDSAPSYRSQSKEKVEGGYRKQSLNMKAATKT